MEFSAEEAVNRVKYSALVDTIKDEEVTGKKGTQAKELIDKIEQYRIMRAYKVHEISGTLKEIIHYEQNMKECDEELNKLLGKTDKR